MNYKKKQSEINGNKETKSETGSHSKSGKSPYEDVDQRFMQTSILHYEKKNEDFDFNLNLEKNLFSKDNQYANINENGNENENVNSMNGNILFPDSPTQLLALLTKTAQPEYNQNQIYSMDQGLGQGLGQGLDQGLGQGLDQGLSGDNEKISLLNDKNLFSFDDRPKKKPQPLSPENKNKM